PPRPATGAPAPAPDFAALAREARRQEEERRRKYREECRAEIETFAYRPVVSVVVPVYNTPLDVLDRALASVEGQFYPNWELCLVDDCSPSAAVRDFLRRRGAGDDRIPALLR